jgi:hypothetical protein
LWFKPAQENSSTRPYLEKPFTEIRLVKCLKVKALRSSPSTAKRKQTTKEDNKMGTKYHKIVSE